MSKKLSRSKRRELREQGLLEAPSRAVIEARREQKRAEGTPATARVHAAREEAAARTEEAQEEDAPAAPKGNARRDRTVLVLVGLTALAALIFWLTQRSPTKETKIDASPGAAPVSSAK
ncbi:MAG: hypothetical protein QM820_56005 [Minicystis sp.]